MGNRYTAMLEATATGGTVEKVLFDDRVKGDVAYVGLLIKHPNGASYAVWFMADDEGYFPGVPEIENVTPARRLKLNIPHTLDKEGNQT